MKRIQLPSARQKELIRIVHQRFDSNMHRHPTLQWEDILAALEAQPDKLYALSTMEETGGEPDVVAYDSTSGEYLLFDCSPESPKGRRSICYDPTALASRKENKPHDSAWGLATAMGIEILSIDQYHFLQTLGEFDTKTSSWIATPDDIRVRGGALFGDRRYGRVFIYHNGAESYYAARGFRGVLRV